MIMVKKFPLAEFKNQLSPRVLGGITGFTFQKDAVDF